MTRPFATLAADVGGTFTDLVGWDGRRIVSGKLSSTTDDQSVGVVKGAESLDMEAARFLHGTTVATNALLERRGAQTALVTSPGFADVVEIGRQDRPSLYDSFADRPEPLVPRERRFEAATVVRPRPFPRRSRGGCRLAPLRIPEQRTGARDRSRLAGTMAASRGLGIQRCSTRVPRVRAHLHNTDQCLPHTRDRHLPPQAG